MLGGCPMPVSSAPSIDGSESRQHLIRARALLQESLQLIDAYAAAPEIGARLQEVIDRLKTRLD